MPFFSASFHMHCCLQLLLAGLALLCLGCADGTVPSRTVAFSDIKDGKDITFIAVERSVDSSVVWTKPSDVIFDDQFPSFAGPETLPDPTLIALGDGGVFSFRIQPGIDVAKLRDSITIAEGNRVVRGDVYQAAKYYPAGFKFGASSSTWEDADPLSAIANATSRGERMKRFKKVMQGLHSYHREFGHLPPAVIYGPDGKPWHSWRVLILPFMGYDYLYKEYDFSVPWDDAKNQAIIERIPEPYVYGEFPSPTSYKTCIALITGQDTAFPLETERGEFPAPSSSN